MPYCGVDEPASAKQPPADTAEEFQTWRLKVNPNHTATLACDDGNSRIVFSKEIEYTDFPLDEISLYFTNSVMMLPSEY